MATNTYVALDKVTTTGAVTSITLNMGTTISQAYTDLIIVANYAGFSSGGATTLIRFNGDSTAANYSSTSFEGTNNGTGSSYYGVGNGAGMLMGGSNWGYGAGQAMEIFQINGYSNSTTHKTVLSRFSQPATGSTFAQMCAGRWLNTAAVTSVTVATYGGITFNTGSTFSLYGIKAWAAEATPKATGGYVYSDSSYWYHAFPFTSTFTPLQSLTADYLVIGGGGAGGSGGGAGAYRTSLEASPLSLTAQAYTITIGAGGASETTTGAAYGTVGGDSIFSTITSSGGGYGGQIGTQTSPNKNGVANGNASGGGSGTGANATGGAAGTYGNKGGDGSATYPYPPAYGSGGGGGAGSAGGNGTSTKGGDGGAGKNVNATWATVTGTGVNGYYAGGGTGYAEPGYELTAIAGSGGGGSALAPNGVVSTGSGGGALTSLNGYKGGNGGSGLVIIRYAK